MSRGIFYEGEHEPSGIEMYKKSYQQSDIILIRILNDGQERKRPTGFRQIWLPLHIETRVVF